MLKEALVLKVENNRGVNHSRDRGVVSRCDNANPVEDLRINPKRLVLSAFVRSQVEIEGLLGTGFPEPRNGVIVQIRHSFMCSVRNEGLNRLIDLWGHWDLLYRSVLLSRASHLVDYFPTQVVRNCVDASAIV